MNKLLLFVLIFLLSCSFAVAVGPNITYSPLNESTSTPINQINYTLSEAGGNCTMEDWNATANPVNYTWIQNSDSNTTLFSFDSYNGTQEYISVAGNAVIDRDNIIGLGTGYWAVLDHTYVNSTETITRVSYYANDNSGAQLTNFRCYSESGGTWTLRSRSTNNVTIANTNGMQNFTINLSGCQIGDSIGYAMFSGRVDPEATGSGTGAVRYKAGSCDPSCSGVLTAGSEDPSINYYYQDSTFTNLTAGQYYYNVSCWDSFGNNNSGNFYTFTEGQAGLSISDVNITSGNLKPGESTTCTTATCDKNFTSNSMSLTATLSAAGNCTLRPDSQTNYTDTIAACPNCQCGSTDTTSQSCVMYENFTVGNHTAYLNCYDGSFYTSFNFSFNGVEILNITVDSITALNSSNENAGSFNTSNMQTIEYMEVNLTMTSTFNDLTGLYLNFTANGTSPCSLGNRQDEICYSYDNTTYKWIQFINNTNTTTYDATSSGGNQGDRIIETRTINSAKNWSISYNIDEHYNPNIAKHYPYNFSDVKWQDGASQRITKNNIILINFSEHHTLPVNADQYKLDFRVNCTGVLDPDDLDAFACNSNYFSSGLSPHDAPATMCALIAQKNCDELQDDGTKYRGIFTKELIDQIGNLSYIVLDTEEPNTNRYYALKTYDKVGSEPMHWYYSTNEGTSWTVNTDGYETEVNINWFFNSNATTEIIFSAFTNTSTNSTSQEFNMTWDISLTVNLPPLVSIIEPDDGDQVDNLFNITWLAADPNDDELNISIFFNGTLLVTNMNQSNTSYQANVTSYADGTYNVTVRATELGTTELYSRNDTHSVDKLDLSCLTVTLLPNELAFQPNTSLRNYTPSDWWLGNFTWTMTEQNISVYNITSAAYNISNDCTSNRSVQVKQNQTRVWYEVWFWDTTKNRNITDSYSTITNITINTSQLINVTLDLNNISETFSNWTMVNDSADWNFNLTFQSILN